MEKKFLKKVREYTDEISTYKDKTEKEKLDILAFSLLALIDGADPHIGPFALRPINTRGKEGRDIAGNLHDSWHQIEGRAHKKPTISLTKKQLRKIFRYVFRSAQNMSHYLYYDKREKRNRLFVEDDALEYIMRIHTDKQFGDEHNGSKYYNKIFKNNTHGN